MTSRGFHNHQEYSGALVDWSVFDPRLESLKCDSFSFRARYGSTDRTVSSGYGCAIGTMLYLLSSFPIPLHPDLMSDQEERLRVRETVKQQIPRDRFWITAREQDSTGAGRSSGHRI
jgi:hypothetical protein